MLKDWMKSSIRIMIAIFGIAVFSMPSALAQIGGPTYQFIKAVREKELLKANNLLSEPGSAIINFKDGDTGEAALHIVTKRRDVPWIAFLLNKGADPNVEDRDGNTPIILAASQGFTEGVRTMILGKANVNSRNRAGETALIKAVQLRQEPIVRLLLAAGADPEISDSIAGYTALDYAAQDRRSAAILKLLKEKAAAAK